MFFLIFPLLKIFALRLLSSNFLEFFIPTKRKQPHGCFLLMNKRKVRARKRFVVDDVSFFPAVNERRYSREKNLAVYGYFSWIL